jgi:hypothetical protein
MRRQIALISLVIMSAAMIADAATGKDAAIPETWKDCRQDADCAAVVTCGSCCADAAINNSKVEDYNNLYAQECQKPRIRCPCVFRKPVCAQGICALQ